MSAVRIIATALTDHAVDCVMIDDAARCLCGWEGYWVEHPAGLLRDAEARKRKRPKISPPLRRSVYERDGYECQACGSGLRLTLDHITPYIQGGEDVLDNLDTFCASCNSKKGPRTPEEWAADGQ